jgi:hypothetical protein
MQYILMYVIKKEKGTGRLYCVDVDERGKEKGKKEYLDEDPSQ